MIAFCREIARLAEEKESKVRSIIGQRSHRRHNLRYTFYERICKLELKARGNPNYIYLDSVF